MFNTSTLRVEKISIRECRILLDIQSRDTINQYLKTLDLFGHDRISWQEFRRVLELQIFLGLKHGRNSKDDFLKLSQSQLTSMFSNFGIDIESRLLSLRNQKQNIHRVAVHLVLNKD
ncbi:hypothetical protein LC605_15020 [Nostoc sp. CHAB 5836]|uniref:hypothetical protein n=1 Tax=Nostoc sp. CHAB 5836 TaxID=2780404 RepID=UPI001E2C4F9F|nr:hypothetical protein [Nostoc sp. CHAB 5836]MCC5616357.1 hypothetical protein [Nostoc sp. CHAB 5836]